MKKKEFNFFSFFKVPFGLVFGIGCWVLAHSTKEAVRRLNVEYKKSIKKEERERTNTQHSLCFVQVDLQSLVGLTL